jgi:polysaccharide export outer membrane protein
MIKLRHPVLLACSLALLSVALRAQYAPKAQPVPGFNNVPMTHVGYPPDATSQPSPTGEAPANYRFHRSDRIELQFPFSPEYNETVAVQPDGRISLREVAPVEIAGKSVTDVQVLIQQAYAGILKEPRVSILLKEFLGPSFYASGEVGHPGRYELHSDITLLQAISEAGGMVNERAAKKEIVVFRPQGNGSYEPTVINIKKMLQAKGTHEDFSVLPGDIIYVPQNGFSKFSKFLPNASAGAYVSPTNF